MLINRYADPQSDSQAILISKAGPLETWMNILTLESEIFLEIPVRNGRLENVTVHMEVVTKKSDPDGEREIHLDNVMCRIKEVTLARPLETKQNIQIQRPKWKSVLLFVLIMSISVLPSWASVRLLKKLLSWL